MNAKHIKKLTGGKRKPERPCPGDEWLIVALEEALDIIFGEAPRRPTKEVPPDIPCDQTWEKYGWCAQRRGTPNG